MTVSELVRKSRSYRRFDQSHALTDDALRALVDLARLSPSGGNKQSLRFAVATGALCGKVFPSLGWAGYLKEWDGPAEGERPTGYIIFLTESDAGTTPKEDAGIAAQSIMLGAVEAGLGGCIFMSVNRKHLAADLALPEGLEPALVIALGKPAEEVVIEQMNTDGDVKYWRDENGVHHVPKRGLTDILVTLEGNA